MTKLINPSAFREPARHLDRCLWVALPTQPSQKAPEEPGVRYECLFTIFLSGLDSGRVQEPFLHATEWCGNLTSICRFEQTLAMPLDVHCLQVSPKGMMLESLDLTRAFHSTEAPIHPSEPYSAMPGWVIPLSD